MPRNLIMIGNGTRPMKDVFYAFYPSLCRFGASIIKDSDLSEDVAQEVFVKLHEAGRTFPNELSLKAYLYVSVRNKCLDILKSRARKPEQPAIDAMPDEAFVDEQFMLDAAAKEECYRIIEAGIASLAPQSRTIMQMFMTGASNQEIADELNISVNTVKTLKARSISALKAKFGTFFLILLSSFLQ